jgi:hypothetical protein
VTIALDSRPSVSTAQWSGASDRARFLRAIEVRTRVVGGRADGVGGGRGTSF